MIDSETHSEESQMENVWQNILCWIVSIYCTVAFGLFAPYYNWDYVKTHGCARWLLCGEVVATAKAVIWPYCIFSSIHVAPTDVSDANAYYNRGSAYFWKEQYSLAIADNTKAIEINPRHVKAYRNRGAAYAKIGEYDLAISDLTKSIEIEPHNALTYEGRGAIYCMEGAYDLSISDLSRAIRIDADSAVAYYWRALAYASKRQYDEGLKDALKARDLGHPSGPKAVDTLCDLIRLKRELGPDSASRR